MNADEIVRAERFKEISDRLTEELSHDAYRSWRISDIAKLRIDAKFLLREIESLQAQLSASQRREKAAVEDMTAMANGMRQDAETDEVCCFACKHNEMYEETHFCNGCEREDCFEWRGPQEAGEVEAIEQT